MSLQCLSSFVAACVCLVATPIRADTLHNRVAEVLKTPGFENGRWGLLVVENATGHVIYEHNPDQLYRPASVTKLFSAAAALIALGPDFRFHTPVVRRGEVNDSGTLRGDLILVAKGDLALGGRTGPEGELLFANNDHTYAGSGLDGELVPTDPLAGLDHLARVVHESGIKAVQGEVLIDDRLFRASNSTGSGPRQVSPIVVNDNLIDILVEPGPRLGDPAQIRTIPARTYFQMDAVVETVAEGSPPRLEVQSVGRRGFAVRGQIPLGHQPILRVFAVEDPTAYARSLFIDALRSRGVRVSASPLAENSRERLPSPDEVARLPQVGEYLSPPFREYIKVILKVSHNLHASTLPLLLTVGQPGQANLASGLKREGEILNQLGVRSHTVSFGGGAGGSIADLVTPRATVTLLRSMAGRKQEFPAFEAALPILGRDGTLAKHVGPDSPARGHVRAKTGTYWVQNELNGRAVLTSKALAGYLETESGRSLVFAFFLNDVSLDADAGNVRDATQIAGQLLGKLCEVFYECADEAIPANTKPPTSGPVPNP
jgi:D-alanyl-D-alanine carboxypeptidase/D-alanyl-D-alanine-endopeptidase (penicillin-binding protein 4)